jgi:hypothetical protein
VDLMHELHKALYLEFLCYTWEDNTELRLEWANWALSVLRDEARKKVNVYHRMIYLVCLDIEPKTQQNLADYIMTSLDYSLLQVIGPKSDQSYLEYCLEKLRKQP